MPTVEHNTAIPEKSWARLDGVDLLRALAIFLVLMNHVNVRLRLNHIPYALNWKQLTDPLANNGQFGVQIFFAVSGFLITSTTLRRWGTLANVSVRDFYKLRFARIAPLLLLLLTILSALHLAGLKDFVVSPQRGGFAGALFSALTFHVNLFEARHGYLPGNWDILWSLSVEETFYLFFPIVCWLLGGRRLFIPFLLAFAALGPFGRTVLAHGNPVWQEYSYLGGMDAIAMGCLTAYWLRGRTLSRDALKILGAMGTAILVFIVGVPRLVYAWNIGKYGLEMTLVALGTCCVIIAASQSKWRSARVLSPILLLGRRSYEIYLTHMFVVFGCLHIFLASSKQSWSVFLFFAGVIILSAALGDVVATFMPSH